MSRARIARMADTAGRLPAESAGGSAVIRWYSSSGRITKRLPSSTTVWTISPLLIIKPVPVSDPLHDENPALQTKLHAVVACSQTKMAGQLAGKRLSAADVGPMLEPANKLQDTRLDRPRNLRELRKCRRCDQDLH